MNMNITTMTKLLEPFRQDPINVSEINTCHTVSIFRTVCVDYAMPRDHTYPSNDPTLHFLSTTTATEKSRGHTGATCGPAKG
jgi:hypothetical protein